MSNVEKVLEELESLDKIEVGNVKVTKRKTLITTFRVEGDTLRGVTAKLKEYEAEEYRINLITKGHNDVGFVGEVSKPTRIGVEEDVANDF